MGSSISMLNEFTSPPWFIYILGRLPLLEIVYISIPLNLKQKHFTFYNWAIACPFFLYFRLFIIINFELSSNPSSAFLKIKCFKKDQSCTQDFSKAFDFKISLVIIYCWHQFQMLMRFAWVYKIGPNRSESKR